MKVSALTGNDNYFEDFVPGEVIKHARGKTVSELENVLITNLVMNTAQGHFNEHIMAKTRFGKRITFGGCTASLVIGLASQDTSENALAELGLDKIRFKVPVCHDDTLYAYTEVLATKESGREDAGEVHFKHWGVNQNDQVVFEGERRTLVKRRSHWGGK
ncbi:MAG: MaoC family dehydratase [Gammaproteobacteria bacterium]|nr:MAG: MaoC family dehydratase [Gammaproteobacteria bacterium]RLA56388.1 MAG: MaoC family dehydratase [Gammaproteobacteria bacterium]HDY82511.1 MaoC family dehydratase [Halieaceae bacterium]